MTAVCSKSFESVRVGYRREFPKEVEPLPAKRQCIFAGSPRPSGARGAGSRREIPLVLGCGVMYFDQDWLFGAWAGELCQACRGGQVQARLRATRLT